jgi:bifunctional NMN adenylyltransferase/nudix hydrolase
MKNIAKIGVIIGRFQTLKLLKEQTDFIQKVLDNHEDTIIFLNITPVKISKQNPFDFAMRKELISVIFPQIKVLALANNPNQGVWSKEIDEKIKEIYPHQEVVMYVSTNLYKGDFEAKYIGEIADLSNNEINTKDLEKLKASPDFRAGVIFAAHNQYPKVFSTVDVAIMRGDEVLLGRKSHQTLFRFIGGFVDPTDDNFEQAAQREAQEETGVEVGNLQYIGTARIDDWRYRNEVDKIITTLFTADYVAGNATAQDDIAEIKWFKINDLTDENFVVEHRVLWKLLKEK